MSRFSSLSLSFHLCKMGIRILTRPIIALEQAEWTLYLNVALAAAQNHSKPGVLGRSSGADV